jgi:hypothetical protein
MHERQKYVTQPVDKDQEDHLAWLNPENAAVDHGMNGECDVGKVVVRSLSPPLFFSRLGLVRLQREGG